RAFLRQEVALEMVSFAVALLLDQTFGAFLRWLSIFIATLTYLCAGTFLRQEAALEMVSCAVDLLLDQTFGAFLRLLSKLSATLTFSTLEPSFVRRSL